MLTNSCRRLLCVAASPALETHALVAARLQALKTRGAITLPELRNLIIESRSTGAVDSFQQARDLYKTQFGWDEFSISIDMDEIAEKNDHDNIVSLLSKARKNGVFVGPEHYHKIVYKLAKQGNSDVLHRILERSSQNLSLHPDIIGQIIRGLFDGEIIHKKFQTLFKDLMYVFIPSTWPENLSNILQFLNQLESRPHKSDKYPRTVTWLKDVTFSATTSVLLMPQNQRLWALDDAIAVVLFGEDMISAVPKCNFFQTILSIWNRIGRQELEVFDKALTHCIARWNEDYIDSLYKMLKNQSMIRGKCSVLMLNELAQVLYDMGKRERADVVMKWAAHS